MNPCISQTGLSSRVTRSDPHSYVGLINKVNNVSAKWWVCPEPRPGCWVWRSTSPTNMAAVSDRVSQPHRDTTPLVPRDSPQALQDSVWGDASSGARILWVFKGVLMVFGWGFLVIAKPAVNQLESWRLERYDHII